MLFNPLDTHQTLAILHIPKTAGTSLAAQVGQAGVPWAHIVNGRYYTEIQLNLGNARDDLIRRKSDILGGTYRFIFGHMTRRDIIYSLDATDRVRFAAFIRDPISRLISEYAYAISPKHPDNVAVLERYPDITTFVETCVDNNVLTHYLERYRGQPVQDIVNDIEQTFCFLGLVENFDKDSRELTSLFSANEIEAQHLNVAMREVNPVSEETMKRIYELNARDVEFYNLVMERWFGKYQS